MGVGVLVGVGVTVPVGVGVTVPVGVGVTVPVGVGVGVAVPVGVGVAVPVGVGVIVPVGVGLGDTATVTLHSNFHHSGATLSAAMLLIIVFVISQDAEIIATPMAVFQKILLPLEIKPGLAPPIKIKNPPQTKSIAAAGGIKPIKTKSIIFLRSLKRSH